MNLKQKILNMDKYKLALSEVDAIIEASDISEQEKIPVKFREFIKSKKNKDYVYIVDKNKKLYEQDIMQETKIIFSLIYRSYFCSEEQKSFLKQKDIEEEERKERELREKYNPDNLFNKNKKEEKKEEYIEENNEQVALIDYKNMKWYRKVIFKITNWFKAIINKD